jgi:hypothetical protein
MAARICAVARAPGIRQRSTTWGTRFAFDNLQPDYMCEAFTVVNAASFFHSMFAISSAHSECQLKESKYTFHSC